MMDAYNQEESKSYIGGHHEESEDEMGTEVGPLDTEQDLHNLIHIPSHPLNQDLHFQKKRLFDYKTADN